MKPALLSRDIYELALLDPVKNDPTLNRLLVVSGYASPAMVFHHFQGLKKANAVPVIDLIYGMSKADGVSKWTHASFVNLAKDAFSGHFTCRYLSRGASVHAKVYVWCKDEIPVIAFSGSANYTQQALVKSGRREVLSECDPIDAYNYFRLIERDTVDCTNQNIEKILKISALGRNRYKGEIDSNDESSVVSVENDKNSPFYGMEKVSLSLLSAKSGIVPERSGLNWGQRPEEGRNPAQAYLPVNGALKTCGFFPERKAHFVVLTDDNEILYCARAQDSGKAIHTYNDNASIGRYIRKRIGIPENAKVTKEDLLRYGRTDVDFYKLDDENYFMDFSVKK